MAALMDRLRDGDEEAISKLGIMGAKAYPLLKKEMLQPKTGVSDYYAFRVALVLKDVRAINLIIDYYGKRPTFHYDSGETMGAVMHYFEVLTLGEYPKTLDNGVDWPECIVHPDKRWIEKNKASFVWSDHHNQWVLKK